MKFLLLTLLFFSGARCGQITVYICDSSNAYRYHLTRNCRGLNNCSHRIISITLEEAKKENKTLCKWEK